MCGIYQHSLQAAHVINMYFLVHNGCSYAHSYIMVTKGKKNIYSMEELDTLLVFPLPYIYSQLCIGYTGYMTR